MLTAGAVAIVVAAAYLLGAFDFLDAKLLDLSFRLRGPRPTPPGIVLIAIDEASLPEGRRYPLPRDYLAELVQRVALGHPRAIMLDVLLDQPDDPEQDARLQAAIARAGNVLLPAVVERSADGDRSRVAGPQPTFAHAALAVGHVSLRVSASDGVVRRLVAGPLPDAPTELPEVSFAALGAAALARTGAAPGSAAAARGRREALLIDFAGPGGTWYHLPARELQAEGAGGLLSGRLVIIGSTLAESGDFFLGPFIDARGSRAMSGLEVQANCVATLLAASPMRLAGAAAPLVAILALGAAGGWLLPRFSPMHSLVVTASTTVVVLALVPALFIGARVYWQGAGPALVVIAVGGTVAARGYVRASARAAAIRGAFGRYLAPAVVDQIIASGEMPRLGGHSQRVAVLFCDMRDFSVLSQRLPPEELVTMLSAFFEAMCVPVLEQGGFVDKLVGDQVMALFGIPYERPDDARRAALAALGMRAAVDAFNRAAAERGWPEVRVAIGVHCGPAVVGNVGWEGRMDYTAMGDTVVLAARLQELCKEFDTDILISPSVREELGTDLRASRVGLARPQGWSEEIEVYTLEGLDSGSAVSSASEEEQP